LISTSDFRKGLKVEFRGDPYEIVDFLHVKMGRGGATVKTKMKNLRTGSVIEETVRAGEKFPRPELRERKMQYLYMQDDFYYFMDTETFEQVSLTPAQLGNAKLFMKEAMEVEILYYRDDALNVELPTFIELVVEKTEPGFKGDTASGGGKPATLETGAVVRVPFHINEGDTIKVDTRTSEYIERVK
jgi:elongation factor P